MKRFFIIAMAAALMLAGCAKESAPQAEEANIVSFRVSLEGADKTELGDNNSVIFKPGDEITISGRKASHTFTTTDGGAEAIFTGDLGDDEGPFYAVNPGNVSIQRDTTKGAVERRLNINMPSCQTGVKGSFDPRAMVSMGNVEFDEEKGDGEIRLNNVCALAKITLSTSDITSVCVCNAAGVPIAGKVDVDIAEDGTLTVGEGTKTNVLLRPQGDTFEPGDYYIVVAPATLTGGIQMMFTRSEDDKIARMKGSSALTFTQSKVKKFGTVDGNLTWKEYTKVQLDFMDGAKISNPFVYPSTFSSNIGEKPTWPDADKVAVTKSGLAMPLHVGGFAASSTFGMRVKYGAATDYISFPRINGLTPFAFRSTAGVKGGSTSVYVKEVGSTKSVNGGSVHSFSESLSFGESAMYYIVDPSSEKHYALGLTSEYQSSRWEFFYTGTAEPTVGWVDTKDPSDSKGTTVTLNGKMYTYAGEDSDFTCGFEYKVKGTEDWTSVTATPATAFSYKLSGLAAGETYVYRAWAKDEYNDKVYGEEEKEFTTTAPAAEVVYTLNYAGANTSKEFDRTLSGLTSTLSSDAVGKALPLLQTSGNHNISYLHIIKQTKDTDATQASYHADGLRIRYAGKGTCIILPALNGLTLVKVEVNVSNYVAANGNIKITDMNDEIVEGGSARSWGEKPASGHVGTVTFELQGTLPGTEYKVYGNTEKKNTGYDSIVLTYSGTETATVQYVYKPTYSGGSVSAKIFVNTVTKAEDLTAGLEVKAGGSGDFVAIGGSSLGTLDAGAVSVSAEASLAAKDVVRAWTSIDGGVTKKYSDEYTVK